jgi:general secretion pathway protein G
MKNKNGFTLLELLIVIVIIGVLATIVFVVLNPFITMQKTRDTVRYNDMRTIEDAIRLYMLENGHAPYLQNNCGPNTPSTDCFVNDTGGSPYSWGLLQEDLSSYLAALPVDPCGNNCSTPGFHSYNYYAPGAYMAVGGVSASQASNMYSLYAEGFETKDGSYTYGFKYNQFHSY